MQTTIVTETHMSSESLDKLTIDKSRQIRPSGRSFRAKALVMIAVILAAGIAFALFRGRAVTIETTSVNKVYPTQSFTLLNASGYVVAQRKAAVASKITGRLEWLGVEEGSRVRGGQVVARLENRDLAASVRQGEAALQSARASLDQARAELNDAAQSFGRQKDLLKQGIVAQADYDVA